MSIAMQLRRGTTAEHASFTGAEGEVTLDMDKKVLVVHDGATPGGFPMTRKQDTAYDIESAKYIDAGMSDEFEASTLDAQWTCVGGVSGTVSLLTANPADSIYDLTTRPGTLLFQVKPSDTIGFRIDDMLENGEQIIVSLEIAGPGDAATGNNLFHIGLSVNDTDTGPSDGNDKKLAWDGTDDHRILFCTDTTFNGIHTAGDGVIGRSYFRLIRNADLLYAFWSPDGRVWTSFNSVSATPYNNFWIYAAGGAYDHAPICAVNWVRHVANINLDPW